MGKTYFLDLPTLITYLQGQTCILQTTLEQGIGSVYLRNGELVYCHIQSKKGPPLEGTQAYNLLREKAKWQVQLTEHAFTQQVSPAAPVTSPEQRPLRLKPGLSFSFLSQIPTRERVAFNDILKLINQNYSTERIKQQLRLPPRFVDEVLDFLYKRGMLE